ncbi:MAG TPA: hypothetical protein VIM98_05015 [Dyella sp.]|uniref:hypothetical protein n=1 Tax=Dyella sp. TaxID=1869338 RepID=UPI002F9420CD
MYPNVSLSAGGINTLIPYAASTPSAVASFAGSKIENALYSLFNRSRESDCNDEAHAVGFPLSRECDDTIATTLLGVVCVAGAAYVGSKIAGRVFDYFSGTGKEQKEGLGHLVVPRAADFRLDEKSAGKTEIATRDCAALPSSLASEPDLISRMGFIYATMPVTPDIHTYVLFKQPTGLPLSENHLAHPPMDFLAKIIRIPANGGTRLTLTGSGSSPQPALEMAVPGTTMTTQ